MKHRLPIACELPPPELARRRAGTLSHLMARVQERRRTRGGLRLRFPPDSGVVAELGRFIEDERMCCRFLDFRLDVTRDGGPIWLRLTGPRGAKGFLAGLFPA